MQKHDLKGLRVAMIVDDNFEQIEMTEPRKALEEAGAKVTLISPEAGPLTGRSHDVNPEQSFKVDLSLNQAKPQDFDALMLPGGSINADHLRMNPKVHTFLQQWDKEGKPIAAICHAPWTLVSSGLVKGRKLTSWPSLKDDIENAGGSWMDQKMVQDRNWVTSRGPQDLKAFNPAMISLFAESRAQV